MLVLVIVLVIELHGRKTAHSTRAFPELEHILGQVSAAAIVMELPFQERMLAVSWRLGHFRLRLRAPLR